MAISGIIDTDNLIIKYFDMIDYFKFSLVSKFTLEQIAANTFYSKIKKYTSLYHKECILYEDIGEIHNIYVYLFAVSCAHSDRSTIDYLYLHHKNDIIKYNDRFVNDRYVIYRIVDAQSTNIMDWMCDNKIYDERLHMNFIFDRIFQTGDTLFLDWYVKRYKTINMYDVLDDDIDDSFGIISYMIDETIKHAPVESKLNVLEWLLKNSHAMREIDLYDIKNIYNTIYEILKYDNILLIDKLLFIYNEYYKHDDKKEVINRIISNINDINKRKGKGVEILSYPIKSK